MRLSQLQYFAKLFSVLLISELCLVQLNAKLQLNSFIGSLENEFVEDLVLSNDDNNLNDISENAEILSVNSYMADEQDKQKEKCSSECKQIEQFQSKAFEFAPKVGLTIENIRSVFQKCSSKKLSSKSVNNHRKCSKIDENSMKIITSCVVQNIYPMFKLDQNQKIQLIPILQKFSIENQIAQVNSLNDNLKYNYDWNESNGDNSDSDYATVDSTAVAPSPDEIKEQLIFAALRGTRHLLASSSSSGSRGGRNESPSQYWRIGHLPLGASILLWIIILIVGTILLLSCYVWLLADCPGLEKCCDTICCPCNKLGECCEYGPSYAAAGECTDRTCTRMNNWIRSRWQRFKEGMRRTPNSQHNHIYDQITIGIPVMPPPQQSHPNYQSFYPQPVRHDVSPIYPPVSRNGKINTSSLSTKYHMSEDEYSRLEMSQFQNDHKQEQRSLAHQSIMYPPQNPQMGRIADHLSQHHTKSGSSTSNAKLNSDHETPSSLLFDKMSPNTE